MLASLGVQTLPIRNQSVSGSDCSESPTVVLRKKHRSGENTTQKHQREGLRQAGMHAPSMSLDP